MLSDKSILRNKKHNRLFRMILRFRRHFAKQKRPLLNIDIQHKLNDIEFTIFSNNCLGGVFYHDAGRQFTSPTINMAFDGEDFIRLCENPMKYINGDFDFFEWPEHNYPLAKVDDIELRFVHYHSKEECIEKWKSRAERIIWDNIFIIATDVDGMYQEKWMERFNSLPYKNKIMFTAQKYPQYNWAIQVPQFKNKRFVHILTDFANLKGQRYYETCFDIAEWIKECSNI